MIYRWTNIFLTKEAIVVTYSRLYFSENQMVKNAAFELLAHNLFVCFYLKLITSEFT